MKTGSKKEAFGFTLVELLVVIAIIAVLLSVLMPALGKVKWAMKVNNCKNYYRQWAMAVNFYAGDYNGYYPRYDFAGDSAVRNPGSTTIRFLKDMHDKYNIPWKMFYCATPPIRQDSSRLDPANNSYPGNDLGAQRDLFYWALSVSSDPASTATDSAKDDLGMIKQAWWIPRKFTNTGRWFPVGPGESNNVQPKKCAPFRDSDSTRSIYPFMTDVCQNPWDIVNPTTDDITIGGHRRFDSDKVQSISEAWTDGHVETVKAADLQPRITTTQYTHWW
jgi:prepilin-type N-terminal cleavage/methylation domain-containing protein